MKELLAGIPKRDDYFVRKKLGDIAFQFVRCPLFDPQELAVWLLDYTLDDFNFGYFLDTLTSSCLARIEREEEEFSIIHKPNEPIDEKLKNISNIWSATKEYYLKGRLYKDYIEDYFMA